MFCFYFALILLVSMLAGLWPAVIIAFASGLAVNWFFTEPLYTFDIAEPANAVILVVMVAIALAVGLQVRRTKIEHHNAAIATRDAELLTVFFPRSPQPPCGRISHRHSASQGRRDLRLP